MTTPTKDEVLAARAEEKRLYALREQAEHAIRAAAGEDLCKAEQKALEDWHRQFRLAEAFENLYRSNGGEL